MGGKPWDEKRDDRAEAKKDAHIAKPLAVAEIYKPYFRCQLHDSTVVSHKRTDAAFTLSFDYIGAADFAHSLAEELELDPVEEVWRVDLNFLNPHLVRFATAKAHRGLLFKPVEEIDRCDFLSDWFFTEDDRMQWIAEFWSAGGCHHLMVDCEDVSVIDHCPKLFEKHFGKGGARLYLDALERKDEHPIDFHVFDSWQTPDYIRRRIVANGLTQMDFLPPTLPR